MDQLTGSKIEVVKKAYWLEKALDQTDSQQILPAMQRRAIANSTEIIAKKSRRRDSLPHSLRLDHSGTQTWQKHNNNNKKKLQANIPDEHRCKNPQ